MFLTNILKTRFCSLLLFIIYEGYRGITLYISLKIINSEFETISISYWFLLINCMFKAKLMGYITIFSIFLIWVRGEGRGGYWWL